MGFRNWHSALAGRAGLSSAVAAKVQDAFAGSEKDVPELQPETPEKPKKEDKFILLQLAEDPGWPSTGIHFAKLTKSL